jgi:hypothetical protein
MTQINIFGEYPAPEHHFSRKGQGSISESALKVADAETQKEVMEIRFYSNYEDPVHSCPHDSGEGGYQFIYGGPYEAREELEGIFSGIVPDDVIAELADELENECSEWSGNSDVRAEEDEEWDYLPSVELSKHLQTFKDSIFNIKALLEIKVLPAQQKHFRGMLYVSVIIAMEAYLLDNFLFCLDADKNVFRKFIETTEHFRSQKIPLSTIFKESEGIDKRGRSYLTKILWHRLGTVAVLYRNTLGIEFPQDMKELLKAVQIRHDFVHRNGRTTDGKEHDLGVQDVKELITTVETFIASMEAPKKNQKSAKDNDMLLGKNAVNLESPDGR